MPKITNKRYRQFLDTGEIDFITLDDLDTALNNIKRKNLAESRSLLIALYYTGARPAEVIELVGKSVKKDNNDILIYVKGKKHGLPRIIRIPYSRRFITEFYKYCSNTLDNLPLFPHFISNYNRVYYTKRGIKKEIIEQTSKINYWVKKWFSFMGEDTPNTYFLRHNRFSMLSEKGATMKDIKFIKGARTLKSVEPYEHMSTARAKKIKKYF